MVEARSVKLDFIMKFENVSSQFENIFVSYLTSEACKLVSCVNLLMHRRSKQWQTELGLEFENELSQFENIFVSYLSIEACKLVSFC